MKKKLTVSFMILAMVLAFFNQTLIPAYYAEEEIPVENASSSSAGIPAYALSAPEIEQDNGTSKRVTFYRDGNPIQSKILLPEGEGPFKTIIITGGLYATLGFYSGKARIFNQNGYAVIEIRPTNNKMQLNNQQPEYLGDFIFEQTLDLSAVIDSLSFFPEFDLSGIYLYGHSMGGLATVYAGGMRQNEIKGMILVEPSFQYPENMTYENGRKLPAEFYPFLSGCNIPVVIVQGTGDRPDLDDFPHFFDKAIDVLPHAELLVIDGADHIMNGDAGKQMAEQAVAVLETWE